MKWLIRFFFKKEFDEIKELLENAKKAEKIHYISFERIPIGTDSFIYEMQPLFTNKSFISWLSEHRIQWEKLGIELLERGEKDKGNFAIARVAMVDDLFNDLRSFEEKYLILKDEPDGEG